MLPAPTLKDVTRHNQNHPGALCCVLFAPLFSKPAEEGIIPRLAYLNYRTAKNIDFYCAGYIGYWHKNKKKSRDPKFIAQIRYDNGTVIPWWFSQKKFSRFVDDFEQASKWRYSGETELIVFNALASFEDCLVLDIERMIKDGAIDRSSDLFESLIQYARSSDGKANAYQFSDGKAPSIFGKAVLEAITEGPKALGKAWKAGRHFAVKSLAR